MLDLKVNEIFGNVNKLAQNNGQNMKKSNKLVTVI